MDETIKRPLLVARLLSSSRGDDDRGPAVWMHPTDARTRLLVDGEVAWVYGPRRHELAQVRVDEGARLGEVVIRDSIVAGPAEIVRVVKPDLDRRDRGTFG